MYEPSASRCITPSMPISRRGRNTCSPPIDWRTSSAHTLNSAIWPAASVWPWCHWTSISNSRELSLTGWVGVSLRRRDTSFRPNNQSLEVLIDEGKITRGKAALQAQRGTKSRRPPHQACLADGRAQEPTRNAPVHRSRDGIEATGEDEDDHKSITAWTVGCAFGTPTKD